VSAARVRVKVCGLRSAADLRAAAGADAVGFVVGTPDARRNIPLARARGLRAQVPPFVEAFLVTRDPRPARLAALQRAMPEAGAWQVHGVASAGHAREVRRAVRGKLVLAVPARPGAERLARALEGSADALLLDTPRADGSTGGAGRPHDWRLSRALARELGKPVILAGGLTAANVGQALRAVAPEGVDVSGGVEGLRGKSRAKVRAFLRAVEDANHG